MVSQKFYVHEINKNVKKKKKNISGVPTKL